MPTIMSHIAVPLAVTLGLGRSRIPTRLMVAGVVAAMLPDADVLGFRLGIPYGDALGHRGASHSLFTAAIIGLAAVAFSRLIESPPTRIFWFVFLAATSHGLLDTLTNGGHGVALFWPWSAERFFAPVHPIEVSPIGLSRFLSKQGQMVLASEPLWIWLPCCMMALALRWMVGKGPDRSGAAD